MPLRKRLDLHIPAPALVILVVIGLLPIVHSMLLARPFRTPQLALLIAGSGGVIATRLLGSGRRKRVISNPAAVSLAALVGFVGWASVAAIMGDDPLRSLVGNQFQGTGMLLWFVCLALFYGTLRNRSHLVEPMAVAVVSSAALLVPLTILGLVRLDLIQEMLVPLNPDGFPLAGLGNSAFVAAFFSVAVLVVLGWIDNKGVSWPLVLALVSFAFVIALTQARGPLITTALLAFAGAVTSWRRSGRKILLAAVTGASAVAVVTSIWLVPTLVARPDLRSKGAEVAVSRFNREQVDGGVQARKAFWGVALRAAKGSWLMGTGPSNYVYAFRTLATPADLDGIPEASVSVIDSHNLALEAAVTTGVPGSLLLMGWIGASLWPSRGGPKGTWLLLAGISLLSFHLYEPLSLSLTPLLAVVLGLGSGAGADDDAPQSSEGTLPKRHWVRMLLAATVALVCLAVAGATLVSDRLYRKGGLEWRASDLHRAISLDPTCTLCRYELGKVLSWDYKKLGLGQKAPALAPFRKAVQIHPNDSEAHIRLGGGLMFLDEPREASISFKRALELEPYSLSAALGLAGARLETGDPKSAVAVLEKAITVHKGSAALEELLNYSKKQGG